MLKAVLTFWSVLEIKVEIKEKILKHKLLEDEIVKPELGEKSKKHLYQTSSILGYLIEYNLLQSNTCVIEFGAGKGMYYLINYY